MSGRARSPEDSSNGDTHWKLPRGRHKLPREFVVESQRARLLSGAARAMAAYGYVSLTIEQILEEARVSRTTFYEHFENKRDCLRVAHEEAFDRLAGMIFRACAEALEWPGKVVRAVAAAIRFAIESPAQARLLIFDAVGASRSWRRGCGPPTISLLACCVPAENTVRRRWCCRS